MSEVHQGNTTSSSDTLEWAEFRLPGALLGREWGVSE